MWSLTALLISGDQSLAQAVRGVIEAIPGLRLEIVSTADAACSRMQQEDVVLLLSHLAKKNDAAEAVRLLQGLATSRRPIATMVIGDHPWPEQALALLRQGAADYLARPLDLTWLAYRCDVLTVRARHQARGPAPAAEMQEVACLGEDEPFLYPTSTPMGMMMGQIQRVAPQDTTLLLTGETGTGKTRLARLIHELSSRRNEPFLAAHCGALAGNLLESEMFGHVRGAFTGADRDRTGKFAAVGGGTILLDEVDTLPLDLQIKLLRVVEERVFEPVGSNRSQPMKARLIVACNRDLEQGTADGWFRSDLFYRLNVVSFYLPPVRERRTMIASLAKHFLDRFARNGSRMFNAIAAEAMRVLEEYDWPGNVRELRNVVERAVALGMGPEIQVEDLPAHLRQMAFPALASPSRTLTARQAPETPATLAQAKQEAEADHICEVLRKHNNNRLRAAAELGISRMTLYTKLRRYGLIDVA